MGVLRTFLALAVVVGHIHIDAGARVGFSSAAIVAVRLFFLISGFYMAFVLHEKYRGRTAAFYWARAVRLLPLHWVTVIVTFACAALVKPESPILITAALSKSISIASPLDFLVATVANLSFLGLDFGLILCRLGMPGCFALTGMSAVPQAWSLAIELAFYAVAPFLAVLGTRAVIAVLIPAAAIKATIVFLGLHGTVWGRMFMPGELTYFMLGMLAFAFYRRTIAGIPNLRAMYILPVAIALVVAYEHLFVALYQNNSIWLETTVDPIFFGIFVFLIPLLFHATRNAVWDNMIGELSYPLYITHVLALNISMLALDGYVFSSPWPRFLIHLTLIILLAAAAWFFVTRPIEQLRGRDANKNARFADGSRVGELGSGTADLVPPGASAQDPEAMQPSPAQP